MKPTLNKTFSDVDLAAKCDNCVEDLPGGAQLWTVDHDDSLGFFLQQ